MQQLVDLLVIGGGINGAGIAADAAGRGLSVLLCEQNDLASATSSYSSKLIHGGIRYLEQYHFKLVRESLIEREILQRKAPFLIKPLQFVLPLANDRRPRWLLRTGLFLYDHLTRENSLPRSRVLAPHDPLTQALQSPFQQGFSYFDCQTDDARLVILNALMAKEHGAIIQPYTKVTNATRANKLWNVSLLDTLTNQHSQINATAIVNATGPWLMQTLTTIQTQKQAHRLRLVQGSHLIVRKLFPGDHAFILQGDDKRIIFIIPYLGHFHLIGTTDTPFTGDPQDARLLDSEKEYLLKQVNYFLQRPIDSDDIISDYSGVRALVDNGTENDSTTTRDYLLELDDIDGQTPLLSVYGGKLTTYRQLAEKAMQRLLPYFVSPGSNWTHDGVLPGGALCKLTLTQFQRQCLDQYSWLPADVLQRYIDQYGDRIQVLLAGITQLNQLGQEVMPGLYEREVEYLKEVEMATNMEDILWRRTKLGLLYQANAKYPHS